MIKRSNNKDLSKLNTFGMKVKAALYVTWDKPEDLAKLYFQELPQPVLAIGSGSNLLLTGDFAGTVLRSDYKEITIDETRSKADDIYVTAGAGLEFDEFCHWAAIHGLWGIENLSGIPGTVGASAVQNVGAYGVEAGDVIVEVNCFEIATGAFVTIPAAECAFAYRDSFFKHNRGRYIVCSVVFHLTTLFMPQLDYGHLREAVERNMEFVQSSCNPYMPTLDPAFSMPQAQVTPMLVRDTVKIIRNEKLPAVDKVGSAGSFFKNPVVSREAYENVVAVAQQERGEQTMVPHFDLEDGSVKIPAAWMIDYCGFKGRRKGGAAVWEKQPLVIVNASGEASPSDIIALENEIINTVREKFAIELHPEVDHI